MSFLEDTFVYIVDPPTTDPMIYDFDGRVTYPGDRITLTCSVTGGNILATLTWTCKGVTAQSYNKKNNDIEFSY